MATLTRYTDLYPAKITPLPPGVPPGVKLRVLITDQYLTVGWLAGQIQRVDIPLEPGAVGPEVTYEGGTITAVMNGVSTDYTVARNPACSICGGGTRMTGWDPFPDASYVEEPRQQVALAQRATSARQMTGLIPQRYTRR